MIKIALIQQTAFGSKTENLKKGMAAIEKAAFVRKRLKQALPL